MKDLTHSIEMKDAGDGRVTLTSTAQQSNLETLALAEFLRRLPPEQRCFFKNCRVVGFVPVIMPKGMFKDDNMHVHKMNPDELDYAMRAMPEFNVDGGLKALPRHHDLGGKPTPEL